jgi:hypothetical protein
MEIPRFFYETTYMTLSDFAQTHWSGSEGFNPRQPKLATLVQNHIDNVLHFSDIHPKATCTGLVRSQDTNEGLYMLNSHYGYISFEDKVSVVTFSIRASRHTHALIRAFDDGVPVWTRVVHADESLDVARPCSAADPSIEAIDYIELIGIDLEIHSLKISVASDPNAHTYLFMDASFHSPSKYAGIRSFPPSAYLLDMESAAAEGYTFPSDLSPPLTPAEEEYAPSSLGIIGRLTNCMIDASDPLLMELDGLVRSLDKSDDFEVDFRNLIIGSSPELLSFILEVDCPTREGEEIAEAIAQIIRRLRILRGDEMSSLNTESLNTDHNTFVTFQRLIEPAPSELVEAANRVALALFVHLGGDKFSEIVVRSKLLRLANSQPVTSDGLDEDALAAVLIQGLGLPINEGTPEQTKLQMLTKIIGILLDGTSESASQLASLLTNYP